MNVQEALARLRGTKYERAIVRYYNKLAENGIDIHLLKSRPEMTIKYFDEVNQQHNIRYYIRSKEIEKIRGKNSMIRFTPMELKFFSNLGLVLTETHTHTSEQEVDDWF